MNDNIKKKRRVFLEALLFFGSISSIALMFNVYYGLILGLISFLGSSYLITMGEPDGIVRFSKIVSLIGIVLSVIVFFINLFMILHALGSSVDIINLIN